MMGRKPTAAQSRRKTCHMKATAVQNPAGPCCGLRGKTRRLTKTECYGQGARPHAPAPAAAADGSSHRMTPTGPFSILEREGVGNMRLGARLNGFAEVVEYVDRRSPMGRRNDA